MRVFAREREREREREKRFFLENKKQKIFCNKAQLFLQSKSIIRPNKIC